MTIALRNKFVLLPVALIAPRLVSEVKTLLQRFHNSNYVISFSGLRVAPTDRRGSFSCPFFFVPIVVVVVRRLCRPSIVLFMVIPHPSPPGPAASASGAYNQVHGDEMNVDQDVAGAAGSSVSGSNCESIHV